MAAPRHLTNAWLLYAFGIVLLAAATQIMYDAAWAMYVLGFGVLFASLINAIRHLLSDKVLF